MAETGTGNAIQFNRISMVKDFLKRKKDAVLRRIIPSIKKQHYLDSLVGPYGYWDQLQQYQLDFLIRRGLEKQHKLLDIGCGPLQGGLAFIDYLNPGGYVGLDLREEPLVAAYRQIAEKNLVHKNPILIYSSNFGKNELDQIQFDYLWASQILYHLPEEKIDRLFEQISSRMTPSSLFFGDIIGDHPIRDTITTEGYWREFSFYLHSIESLQTMADQYRLTLTSLGPIGELGYPKEIALHTNRMLKITKRQE